MLKKQKKKIIIKKLNFLIKILYCKIESNNNNLKINYYILYIKYILNLNYFFSLYNIIINN